MAKCVPKALALVSLAIVAGHALLAESTTMADQERPQFRSGIDVTQVLVRVLDRQRKPIRGLRTEDFRITIDGTARPVVAVVEASSPQPLESGARWLREFGAEIATNRVADPRLFAVILDDIGFGAMSGDPWALRETRAIFEAFVNQLGPADLVSVVFTGDNRAPQDFTNDRRKLLAALGRFHDFAVPGGAGRAVQTIDSAPERRVSRDRTASSKCSHHDYAEHASPLDGNQEGTTSFWRRARHG